MSHSTPTFTGTQVNYYAVCKRKLWLFSHDIEMERENENVQLGRLIGQDTYKREQKEIALDERVVFDWMELKENADGTRTVHEVKKSKAVSAAHRLQMLYYLFYLQSKGVAARGQIDYPLLKKSEKLELTPQSQDELMRVLDDIRLIVHSPEAPPRLDNKGFCSKCAYFELCWS
jgi:CRISPR-associated exonuclease Cas4